jgi:hypothetical protein
MADWDSLPVDLGWWILTCLRCAERRNVCSTSQKWRAFRSVCPTRANLQLGRRHPCSNQAAVRSLKISRAFHWGFALTCSGLRELNFAKCARKLLPATALARLRDLPLVHIEVGEHHFVLTHFEMPATLRSLRLYVRASIGYTSELVDRIASLRLDALQFDGSARSLNTSLIIACTHPSSNQYDVRYDQSDRALARLCRSPRVLKLHSFSPGNTWYRDTGLMHGSLRVLELDFIYGWYSGAASPACTCAPQTCTCDVKGAFLRLVAANPLLERVRVHAFISKQLLELIAALPRTEFRLGLEGTDGATWQTDALPRLDNVRAVRFGTGDSYTGSTSNLPRFLPLFGNVRTIGMFLNRVSAPVVAALAKFLNLDEMHLYSRHQHVSENRHLGAIAKTLPMVEVTVLPYGAFHEWPREPTHWTA